MGSAAGHVLVTPNNTLRIAPAAADDVHCPSGNRLLESIATSYGHAAAGVVLTGMGDDGANGLLAIRNAGGSAVAQDSDSCVVDGMPAVCERIGAVTTRHSLQAISAHLRNLSIGVGVGKR